MLVHSASLMGLHPATGGPIRKNTMSNKNAGSRNDLSAHWMITRCNRAAARTACKAVTGPFTVE